MFVYPNDALPCNVGSQEEVEKLLADIKANRRWDAIVAPPPSPPAIMSSVPNKPVYVAPVVLSEEERIARAKRFLFGK